MGSINTSPGGIIRFVFVFSLAFFTAFNLFAQNEVSKSPVPVSAEISRLEKLAASPGAAAQGSRERYYAFTGLIRLNQLSGNTEAALNACERALSAFPNDGRILLEQCRLLISMGEYQRAEPILKALVSAEGDREFLIQSRYLGAQLEAFRSGNAAALSALADDPEFSGHRNSIYYTLWKLTGLPVWKTRLAAEFPQSPEAIIASGAMNPAPTPLWLLFPGRAEISLSAAEPIRASTQPAVQPVSPAPVAPGKTLPETASPASAQTFLQTGLYSRVESARVMTEVLEKAGFKTQIVAREVNGANYWAACVPAGNDVNAMIRKLLEAGFESFPIK